MKVVIIGSLSKEDEIDRIKSFFSEIPGCCVTDPIGMQLGSLVKIQKKYIEEISNADLVVVCPKMYKRISINEVVSDQAPYEEHLYMGESTSYEIALAKHFGKPVVYWSEW